MTKFNLIHKNKLNILERKQIKRIPRRSEVIIPKGSSMALNMIQGIEHRDVYK
jgi:hypothetical protein